VTVHPTAHFDPARAFSCPDWWERLQAGAAPFRPVATDPDQERAALGCFMKMPLPDIPGQPRFADRAFPWQAEVVKALFGARFMEPDARGEMQLVAKVPELFLMIPKKNGKTTFAAAVSLIAMLRNPRPRAQMLYIAARQEIAEIAYNTAVGMIEAEDFLVKRFHVMQHRKMIRDRATGATLKIVSFDMKIVTGAKPAFVLIDEIHLLGAEAAAARVMKQLRDGTKPNREALIVMITTQSDVPPAGVFKAELARARAIRDGSWDAPARTLPVLFEFPEAVQRSEAWRNPALWPLVSPALGDTLDLDSSVADADDARLKGPAEERIHASQNLNIEIGLALHSDRWVGADFWEGAGTEAGLTVESLMERSDVVVFGIDGGGVDDLFGLGAIGRCKATGRKLLACRAWAQPSAMEGRPEIAATLRDFEADGDLIVCGEGDEDRDFREAAALIASASERGLLPAVAAVGLDPRGVAALYAALLAAGLVPEQLVAVPQGTRLSSSIWGMERELKDRRLRHGGTRMMAWCVGNAKAEMRGNSIYISKQAAGKSKIDPLVAAFNAFELMARNPEPAGRSVYEALARAS